MTFVLAIPFHHTFANNPQAPPPPPARADPMSLSSIMSAGTDNDPPPKPQPLPSLTADHYPHAKQSHPHFVKQEPMHSPAPADLAPHHNGILHPAPYEPLPPVALAQAVPHTAAPRELPVPDEAEIEAALAHIETKEMGGADEAVGTSEHDEWNERSRKRGLEVTNGEIAKRKVN